MGVWGGAHTGFVGEEPSFGSLADGSFDRSAEAAASLEKVVAAKEDPSVRYSLGILYAYYLEQPDKGLEQLQKALDNPNTPADLKKAVSEEVTKIKEHKNHTPQQAQ